MMSLLNHTAFNQVPPPSYVNDALIARSEYAAKNPHPIQAPDKYNLSYWRAIICALRGDMPHLHDTAEYTVNDTLPSGVVEAYDSNEPRLKATQGYGRKPPVLSDNKLKFDIFREVNEHVIQLDSRFQGMKWVYPAVVCKPKKGVDWHTYTWVCYSDDGTSKIRHICAHILCKRSPFEFTNRVCEFNRIHSLNPRVVICRYKNVQHDSDAASSECHQWFNRLQITDHYNSYHTDKARPRHRNNQPATATTASSHDSDVAQPQQNTLESDEVYEYDDDTLDDIMYVTDCSRSLPLRRYTDSWKPMLPIVTVTLTYSTLVNNQPQQVHWRPGICSKRSNIAAANSIINRQSNTKKSDDPDKSDPCVCAITAETNCDHKCTMYKNGVTLRWVIAAELPYIAAIPHFRCKVCNCAGGTFSSNYTINEDVVVQPNIMAFGGTLGNRVEYIERTFYMRVITDFAQYFNATKSSELHHAAWSNAWKERKAYVNHPMYVDPYVDPAKPQQYSGLRLTCHYSKFLEQFVDELDNICYKQSILSDECISNLFFDTYARNELIKYSKLVNHIIYTYGAEHIINDHTYDAVKQHHITDVDDEEKKHGSGKNMVHCYLSTVMSLLTQFIISSRIVPNTSAYRVSMQLREYFAVQNNLNPPALATKLKSFGCDNTKVMEHNMARDLYHMMEPGENRNKWFTPEAQAAHIRFSGDKKQFYQWLNDHEQRFVKFTEDTFHLIARIVDVGAERKHPDWSELNKTVRHLFNSLRQRTASKVQSTELDSQADSTSKSVNPSLIRITKGELLVQLKQLLKVFSVPLIPDMWVINMSSSDPIINQDACDCQTCSSELELKLSTPVKPLKPVQQSKQQKSAERQKSSKQRKPVEQSEQLNKPVESGEQKQLEWNQWEFELDNQLYLSFKCARVGPSREVPNRYRYKVVSVNNEQVTRSNKKRKIHSITNTNQSDAESIQSIAWCYQRLKWVYLVKWKPCRATLYTNGWITDDTLLTENGCPNEMFQKFIDNNKDIKADYRPVLNHKGRHAILAMIKNIDNIYSIAELLNENPKITRASNTSLLEAFHRTLSDKILNVGAYLYFCTVCCHLLLTCVYYCMLLIGTMSQYRVTKLIETRVLQHNLKYIHKHVLTWNTASNARLTNLCTEFFKHFPEMQHHNEKHPYFPVRGHAPGVLWAGYNNHDPDFGRTANDLKHDGYVLTGPFSSKIVSSINLVRVMIEMARLQQQKQLISEVKSFAYYCHTRVFHQSVSKYEIKTILKEMRFWSRKLRITFTPNTGVNMSNQRATHHASNAVKFSDSKYAGNDALKIFSDLIHELDGIMTDDPILRDKVDNTNRLRVQKCFESIYKLNVLHSDQYDDCVKQYIESTRVVPPASNGVHVTAVNDRTSISQAVPAKVRQDTIGDDDTDGENDVFFDCDEYDPDEQREQFNGSNDDDEYYVTV